MGHFQGQQHEQRDMESAHSTPDENHNFRTQEMRDEHGARFPQKQKHSSNFRNSRGVAGATTGHNGALVAPAQVGLPRQIEGSSAWRCVKLLAASSLPTSVVQERFAVVASECPQLLRALLQSVEPTMDEHEDDHESEIPLRR